MHAENPENFQIPPQVIKRHVRPDQFVELRIDSPRFSVHEDALEKCSCPSCNGELTKPILRHDNPASLVPLPKRYVPSRGWGEDFWVKVSERCGDHFRGVVDNALAETINGLYKTELILKISIMFARSSILPTTCRPTPCLTSAATMFAWWSSCGTDSKRYSSTV